MTIYSNVDFIPYELMLIWISITGYGFNKKRSRNRKSKRKLQKAGGGYG